jgi:hypothetical protein
MGLPTGSNDFTLSRFLVPYLMNYEGHAIFCDASDMVMLADVSELDNLFDEGSAVQVVKHPEYQTRHKTKYRGTSMECPNSVYSRKNWASVMLINCGHPAWRGIGPDTLPKIGHLPSLQLRNCPDNVIGELPDAWNRLVDEGHSIDGAKVLHWTAGIPAFEAYTDAPGADIWNRERLRMKRVG